VIKTYGEVIDEMIIKSPAGIKVAFGENPKRNASKYPVTRMGVSGLLREALVSAKNYSKKTENGYRDLKMEALVGVLIRKIPLMAHAHRADDIATAIRIAREFNIDLVIHHGTEGYKISHHIAKHKIPVVVGPTLTSPKKIETKNRTFENAAILSDKGVDIAIMSDHPFLPAEHILRYAELAIQEGLPEEVALKALTINPARILGIEDRVGSIEKGKDADLVILSDEPFNKRCKVEMVFINSNPVYRRKKTHLQVS
jgi:imidazolonepropionase-like amidohydrolase